MCPISDRHQNDRSRARSSSAPRRRNACRPGRPSRPTLRNLRLAGESPLARRHRTPRGSIVPGGCGRAHGPVSDGHRGVELRAPAQPIREARHARIDRSQPAIVLDEVPVGQLRVEAKDFWRECCAVSAWRWPADLLSSECLPARARASWHRTRRSADGSLFRRRHFTSPRAIMVLDFWRCPAFRSRTSRTTFTVCCGGARARRASHCRSTCSPA